MNDQTYVFRKSLWAPELGTVFSGESLKILGCFCEDSSISVLLQNRSRHSAVLEVVSTLRLEDVTYLALAVPISVHTNDSATAVSVTLVEVLNAQNCKITNLMEIQSLIDSQQLQKLLTETELLQTKIDLLQINVLIESNISERKFSFDELEKLGVCLNPYGYSNVPTGLSYNVALKWRNEELVYVVLTARESIENRPAVELELLNVISTSGAKYCIFVQPGPVRAEADQPFFFVVRQISEEEFISVSSSEAAALGGIIVSACNNGLRPSEEEIELCLGKVNATTPPRATIEQLLADSPTS